MAPSYESLPVADPLTQIVATPLDGELGYLSDTQVHIQDFAQGGATAKRGPELKCPEARVPVKVHMRKLLVSIKNTLRNHMLNQPSETHHFALAYPIKLELNFQKFR